MEWTNERNARLAYETVMTYRLICAFHKRENFIRYHFDAIEALRRLHGRIVPVEFHKQTILASVFACDGVGPS